MPQEEDPAGREEPGERKCPLCGAVLEGVGATDSGEFRCGHCGSTARYEDENLLAIDIPGYHRRLAELESMNKELVQEIELEGMRGPGRDMQFLQRKHLERQDILCEYSFLSHFRSYVERW